MKTLYLGLFVILLHYNNCMAYPFTVLAQSGLNVRSEPTSKSNKIGFVPFGEVVEADINEDNIDYSSRFKIYTEVIEGKRGFWMRISYQNLKGYIFSGYGLLGNWVVKSSELNSEYRLLQLGQYCDAINFDPKLNWYGLVKSKGTLTIKKTKISLRLVHEYTELDTLDSINEFWREFPLTVQCDLTDSIFMLIGSSTPLKEGPVFSEFQGNEWGYGIKAKFLYPEETFETYFKNRMYKFRAYENIEPDKENTLGFKRKYQIELEIEPETSLQNLSEELELYETGKMHSIYKTPQLIWLGDINSDDVLDFIYYSHTMTESCGVCWEYHLFMSDATRPERKIKKVAVEIQCNCIT